MVIIKLLTPIKMHIIGGQIDPHLCHLDRARKCTGLNTGLKVEKQ